jgi:hypothetical protein
LASKVQVKACFELDPLEFPQLPAYDPLAFTRSPRAHSPVKMSSQEQGGEGAKKEVTALSQVLRQRRQLIGAAGGAGAEAGHSNSDTVTAQLLELTAISPAALVAHTQI